MDYKLLNKFGLGSAQFGLKYGINKQKIPRADIKKILKSFNTIHGKIIDTSPLYGFSEKMLGELSPKNNKFQYVTKIPKINSKVILERQINNSKKIFYKSLKNLKKKSVYGLLIHSINDIFKPGGDKLLNLLISLKKKRMIKKIGVSVYSKKEIDGLLKKFTPDIIQLPINLLDQRLIKNNYLSKLKKKKIEIHARSIFLQGILISKKNFFPFKNKLAKEKIKEIKKNIIKQNISLVQAGVYFVLQQKEIDSLIIGFSSYKDFYEIKKCFNCSFKKFKWNKKMEIKNEKILNPSNW